VAGLKGVEPAFQFQLLLSFFAACQKLRAPIRHFPARQQIMGATRMHLLEAILV
jgi:hypothetical protein